MLKSDIKLEKFKNALITLEAVYLLPKQENRLNIDGTIQRFEYTFELAWKFLKDYFSERGTELNFPKEVLQQAYSADLIDNEEVWVKMLKDRNMTSHSYNEKVADEIYNNIKSYVPALRNLLKKVIK